MNSELPDRARLRASDADRDAVVELLRQHGAAGRLDIDELRERIGRALSSKTFGELDGLTADLPGAVSAAPAAPYRPPWARPLFLIGAELAVINFFFVAIWFVAGASGSFWPGWLILLSVFLFARRAVREQLRQVRRAERAERRAS